MLCRSFDPLMLHCCRNTEPRSTLKMTLSMKWPWKRKNFRRFPPIRRQVLSGRSLLLLSVYLYNIQNVSFGLSICKQMSNILSCIEEIIICIMCVLARKKDLLVKVFNTGSCFGFLY